MLTKSKEIWRWKGNLANVEIVEIGSGNSGNCGNSGIGMLSREIMCNAECAL